MASESSYEYQCMRAELLGQEKPDRAAFDLEQQKIREKELQDMEMAEMLEVEGESCESAKSKMNELNSILTRTQKKINTFTGSPVKTLTRMFSKQKIEESSLRDDDGENKVKNCNSVEDNQPKCVETVASTSSNFPTNEAKIRSLDIDKKMTSHLDKLDELINKAEKADLSMTHQNKQMKKYIKK